MIKSKTKWSSKNPRQIFEEALRNPQENVEVRREKENPYNWLFRDTTVTMNIKDLSMIFHYVPAFTNDTTTGSNIETLTTLTTTNGFTTGI